jgi:hypothetical protein
MNFSDETVMAYVDGELDDATRAALERAAADDSDLAQRIARQRGLRARLGQALDPVLDEPLPERLLAPLRSPPRGATSNVVALRPPRAPPSRWSWPQGGAIAASLILGLWAGARLELPLIGGPLYTSEGRLVAGGSLAHALSQQLSSTQPASAGAQIGVSFRARDGGYCRTFVLRAKEALAGLACRAQGRWRITVLQAAQPDATGAYRPAAASLPPAVTRAVDELMSGEPLDAAEERAARGSDWSR